MCLLPLSQTQSISGKEVKNLFRIADDGSFDLLSETEEGLKSSLKQQLVFPCLFPFKFFVFTEEEDVWNMGDYFI